VPIIVVTAHDEPGTADRVRSLGACAYLKKPVDRDALLSAITAARSPSKEQTPPKGKDFTPGKH
jgi:AmiR/NasT family two-component response regulator